MRLTLPLLLAATVVAACADHALEEEAPRDAVAPRLDVRSPERGSILENKNTVEVRGTVSDEGSGVAKLRINDVVVPVAADGSFSVTLGATPGLTLLHTVATDVAGNQQSDTRAVLSGTLVPVDTMLDNAVVARLDKNAVRIAGDLAARGLDKLDLEAILKPMNPVLDIPVPCLGARVDIDHVKKGAVKLTVAPVGGGLQIAAEIDDLDVGLKIAYDVGCKTGTATPSATAKAFRLSGVLGLAVGADGKLAVDASKLSASFDQFVLNSAILPREVTDIVQAPLAASLASLATQQLGAQVPGLLGGMVGGKDVVVPAGAETLTIAVQPTVLDIDESGLRVALNTKVFVHGAPGSVFLTNPAARPAFTSGAAQSIRVAVADDAMNQVLSSLWGAGIFDQTFEVDKAGNYGGVGVLFDRVELAMRLPPVVTALPDGGGLRVSVGDVECHFIKSPPGEATRTVTRLSMSLETTLTATAKDSRVTMVAAEPVVWLDVLSDGVSGANPFNQESVRQLGSFAAKNLMGFVTQKIGEIPIPAVEGMTIVDAQVTTGERDGGYMLVTGNVTVR